MEQQKIQKKFEIRYQKEDYSFDKVIIEAENKREAVKKFPYQQGFSSSGRRLLLANTKELNEVKPNSSQD